MKISIGTLACAIALATSGCATITSGETQQVNLNARAADGQEVGQATCTLENDKGSWTAQAPGVVSVRRSADDLMVACRKEGFADGALRAVSGVTINMFGNILFGGLIGAAIDHMKGTAYDYPSDLPIVMGASTTVDKRRQGATTASSQQAGAGSGQN